MIEDLTPDVALDTATALRSAASRRPFPVWFPPTVGIGYVVSLSLIGSGDLIHGTAARAVGLTGAALVVVTFAMTLPLLAGWRRAGVVPKFDACDMSPARRRQRVLSFVLAAVAAAALVLARWGWVEIAVGVVLGASLWRRLARQAAR